MLVEEKIKNGENIVKDDKENKISSEKNIQEIPEKKTYINFHFCSISISIIITYVFIIDSISSNIINRVVFYEYEFEFEIFLILLEEIFNICFYIIASKKIEVFKKLLGEITFKDFYKLKYQYIGYTLFSILMALISLLGYQLVKNIPMYVNLRKFVTVMIFTYRFFFKKQKIGKINIIVIILLTAGAIFAGIDDYDTDYIGFLVIFSKNTLTVINLEITENLKKKNGISNLKLLAYKSFISPPLLLIIMFAFGEHKEIINYFNSPHNFSYVSLFLCLFFNIFILIINNLSFFISNEKNNSLFTQLLSDSKYIFITLFSFFILKTFSFTWKNILGLLLSTLGAVIISISSMYDNIQFKKKIQKDKKRFIELSNIEEMDSNNEDKNTNINNNDMNINKDNKEENNDTNNNNISTRSTDFEDNNNDSSINISNDNISNININNNDDNINNNIDNINNNIDNINKPNDGDIINNNITNKNESNIDSNDKSNNDNINLNINENINSNDEEKLYN